MADYKPEPGLEIRRDSNAETDPLRNPRGVYSGMAKRTAIMDGEFVNVENMPKESAAAPLRRRKR